MISLKKQSALPVWLGKNGLVFSSSVLHDKPERIAAVIDRVFEKSGDKKRGIDFFKRPYYIYRNVRLSADAKLFQKQGIRYDITLLWGRTRGHIHKPIPRKGRPPEIYQVLYGKAIFYAQTQHTKQTTITAASAGETVRISGEVGHVTVNASPKEPLVIANLFIDRKNASDYSFFKKTGGPAFLPMWTEKGIAFMQNPKLPAYAVQRKKSLGKKPSLYAQFTKKPNAFSYLK